MAVTFVVAVFLFWGKMTYNGFAQGGVVKIVMVKMSIVVVMVAHGAGGVESCGGLKQ